MAKAQGIGSTAGNSEAAGTTEAPANPPEVRSSAPVAAKGPEKITAKILAKELAAIARKPAGAEAAAEAKRCAGTLHRVHGATSPELEKAVRAYYRDPSAANAAAIAAAVESEKFDG